MPGTCSTQKENQDEPNFIDHSDSNRTFDATSSTGDCNENSNYASKQQQWASDEFVCFAIKDRVSNCTLEDSVVFKSPSRICKTNFYKVCSIQESCQNQGILSKRPTSAILPCCGRSEECGVILTAQNETWELSSIEDPDVVLSIPECKDDYRNIDDIHNAKILL